VSWARAAPDGSVDEHCQHVRAAQKRSTRQTRTGDPLKYSVYPTSMSRDSDSSHVLEVKVLQRELLQRAAQPIDALSSIVLSRFHSPLATQPNHCLCIPVDSAQHDFTTLAHPNPPLLRSPASSICSWPPPIEYRRSPSSKSLPDQHVITTSQRSCPSCPCPSTPYLLP